tara:strand:- start:39482 stop:39838 length:357 start_codon:yes stop_codon:yes gene_type:complete
MSHITGRAFITVNGKRLKSRPGATLKIGGFNRTPVIGDDGVHGYTEEVVAPEISCTISHDKDTSLTDISNSKNDSVGFETDSGKTYLQSGSFLTTPPELNGQDGGVALTYAGLSIEEL